MHRQQLVYLFSYMIFIFKKKVDKSTSDIYNDAESTSKGIEV